MAPLLQINDLQVDFDTPRGRLRALCGVSFEIEEGEIFGLVGESGCGKSVTGLAMLGLVPPPGRVSAGTIRLHGDDLLAQSEEQMRHVRGNAIAAIFQDPMSSLNPVFQVGAQIADVLRRHHPLSKHEARAEVLEALRSVGLPDVERIYASYPHELSGGMQQRVMIAMALVCRPALLIADEPTTALDVTIQAQILRLLCELRDTRGISIMLITHDLGVVAEVCDRVTVLYAGRVVETALAEDLFANPRHPYTQGLMAAIPRSGQKDQLLSAIPGTVPSNPGAIRGCAFASRCPHTFDRCQGEEPPLYPVTDEHASACYLEDTKGAVDD